MVDLVKYKVRYDADVTATNLNAGDTDQVVTDYYNDSDVSPDADIRVSQEEVVEAIDIDEFKALDAPNRESVTLALLPVSIVIRGSNARTILLAAFTAVTGPNTRTNLLALQTTVEAKAERTRAQRGGILGNSLLVNLIDTTMMRAL